MTNYRTDSLNGVLVQYKKTSFRLTDEELNIIVNKDYHRPIENHLTKTRFLLKDPRLKRVKNFLDEHMKNYIENTVEIENKFIMTQSWSTTTKKGERHHPHNHPNNIFSLVFYVDAVEDSGNIIFNLESRLRERYNFSFKVKNWNTFNSYSWEYQVRTGDLILFPSWVTHETKPNLSDKNKIIIGANYFVHDVIQNGSGVEKMDIQLGDVDDD